MSIYTGSNHQTIYLRQAEAAFEQLCQRLETYQWQTQHLDTQSAVNYSIDQVHEVAFLSVKRNAAQRKLEQLQHVKEQNWSQAQRDFEQAWNELNDVFWRAIASLEQNSFRN